MRRSPRVVLALERLEARAVPATLFVGSGQAYADIHDALNAAAGGDTIQIEPGAQLKASAPTNTTLDQSSSAGASQIVVATAQFPAGEVIDLDSGGSEELAVVAHAHPAGATTTLTLASPLRLAHTAGAPAKSIGALGLGISLTLQGDPGYAPAALGALSDLYLGTPSARVFGLELSGVVLLPASGGETIGNNQVDGDILNVYPLGGTYQFAGSGGNDVISANQIQGSVFLDSAAGEQILFNQFTGAALDTSFGGQGSPGYRDKVGLVNCDASLVRANRMDVSDTPNETVDAVFVAGGSCTVQANDIRLASGPAAQKQHGNNYAVDVDTDTRLGNFVFTSARMLNNVLDTAGNGGGILFDGGAPLPTSAIVGLAEGNDLHGDYYGVVTNSGTTPRYGVRVQVTLQYNDFRGFTLPASSGPGAVVSDNTLTVVSAERNVWAVANPADVVREFGNEVDVSNPLSPDEAYVESLYSSVLGRSGDLATEVDPWVGQINQVGYAGVAADVIYSTEHFNALTEGFYRTFLRRAPDAGGQAAFASLFAAGATLEDVLERFLDSVEYHNLVNQSLRGKNDAYIQSLYTNLLGRDADPGGLALWEGLLQQLGYQGTVGGFVGSFEYRRHFVGTLYQDMLHRTGPPADSELNFWASSGLDLLAVQTQFSLSQEFYQNG
jgi:hypothetical protein